MKKTVFLSGPIRGITRLESLGWRMKATELLSSHFNVIHALRGREEKEAFSDPKTAVIRDLDDIAKSDIVLINDTIENASMIGTAMEVFYAFELKKPVIIFGSSHAKDYWLNYHSHARYASLEEACDMLKRMFSLSP